MMVKPIAKSYWRLVKNGNRTFNSVPDTVKTDVLILAGQDVENGVITAQEFEDLTSKTYIK